MRHHDLSTLRGVRDAVAAGDVSAVEICHAALAAIDARDADLHAFTAVDAEKAIARAAAIDGGEDRGPLAGVPIALKDNICTRALPTTASSKVLAGYTPPYDATVVERLLRAGAVVVGKTNCDEFAMGSSTENSALGPSRNPWDRGTHPGRFERRVRRRGVGGPRPRRARVRHGRIDPAARRVLRARGTQADLRPGVALRPARLRLVARSDRTADAHGGRRRNPDECHRRSGPMPMPQPAAADVPDFVSALTGEVIGLRIGVPERLLEEGVAPEVSGPFREALHRLQQMGATAQPIELPHAHAAIPVYYLVATAEASSNLARYDGVRYGHRTARADSLRTMYNRTRDEGFGAEVKRRIMLGTYVLSAGYYDAYYRKAQQVRTLIRGDYDAAFSARGRHRDPDHADPGIPPR